MENWRPFSPPWIQERDVAKINFVGSTTSPAVGVASNCLRLCHLQDKHIDNYFQFVLTEPTASRSHTADDAPTVRCPHPLRMFATTLTRCFQDLVCAYDESAAPILRECCHILFRVTKYI